MCTLISESASCPTAVDTSQPPLGDMMSPAIPKLWSSVSVVHHLFLIWTYPVLHLSANTLKAWQALPFPWLKKNAANTYRVLSTC